MSQIRFFTDEDVHGAIAPHLRAAGFDAVSSPEAGRLGTNDPEQLLWATQQGYTLVTFNVSDFARLHSEWLTQGQHHAGLIVSQQRPIGDALRRLQHLASKLSAEAMANRLEYLSNW
jgi:hypothetical protein